MNTKAIARELSHALRILHQLDNGGRHSADTPRDEDAALRRAADDVILLCKDLAAAVRREYPHSRD